MEAEPIRKAYRMKHWRVVMLLVCAAGVPAGCDGRKESRDKPQTAPAPARAEPDPMDTPERLLRKVLALAGNKRYEELAEHIVPLRRKAAPAPAHPPARAEPQDLRAEILEGIRSKKKAGEFAYSNEALLAIVANHLDRIGPVPDEMLEYWAAGKGLGQDGALRQAAKSKGRDLCCFRRSGAFILMQKLDGQYRLAYWRDINQVLGEAATVPADTRRYHDLEPLTVKVKQNGRFVRAAVSLVTQPKDADVLQNLLRTKEEDVRQWLMAFLAGQKPEDLADKANRDKLQNEIRAGLNRLLYPQGEPRIDAVIFRELTVQR